MIVKPILLAENLVASMGAIPRARLPLSIAALKLLKQEPGTVGIAVAKSLLDEVRKEYGNPKTMVKAAALAEETKAFIRSQAPSVERFVLC